MEVGKPYVIGTKEERWTKLTTMWKRPEGRQEADSRIAGLMIYEKGTLSGGN